MKWDMETNFIHSVIYKIIVCMREIRNAYKVLIRKITWEAKA
jgi:hypothetical protein